MTSREASEPGLLVAVEFGPSGDLVLHAAIELARRLGIGLHLVHVAPPEPEFVGYVAGPDSVRDAVADELRDEHRQVQELVERSRAGGVATTGRLVRGPTVDALCDEAERVGAELIVIGRHARGAIAEALLGSTSRDVMRCSARPVLIVPTG